MATSPKARLQPALCAEGRASVGAKAAALVELEMSQVVKKPLSDNAKALMWTAVGVVAFVALTVVLYYAGMTGGTGGAG